MTQYATLCHTWIPAIRHIILELKKENEVTQMKYPQSSLLPVIGRTEKSEEK